MNDQKFRLLILDDQENVIKVLQMQLEDEYDVATQTSPNKALEEIREFPDKYQVILCDQRMPEMYGDEFLNKVRKVNDLIQAVMISGEIGDTEELADVMDKAHMHGYIEKPWNRDNLLGKLKAASESYEKLESDRYRDALTGSYNRRKLNDVMRRVCLLIEHEKLECATVMEFDLDHFKRVNDAYGYSFGHKILVEFVKTIQNLIHNEDEKQFPYIFGRFGGEEFLLIMPGVNLNMAVERAEYILFRVQKKNIGNLKQRDPERWPFGLTVSIGIAPLFGDDTNNDIFGRVSRALKKAKKGGRNQVALYVEKNRDEIKVLSQKFVEYITKVTIENIRCFEKVEVSFGTEKSCRVHTVILGDNATGKTTLLRCIALGLCGEMNASALMKKIPGPFLRVGSKTGFIKIELEKVDLTDNKLVSKRTITTFITNDNGEEELEQKHSDASDQKAKSDEFFICGYGTQRTKFADKGFEAYSVFDALMPLFDYDVSLQNPELILRRESRQTREILEKKLLDILMLEDSEALLYDSGAVKLRGSWKHYFPFSCLSDGYRSSLQWILDLLGWLILAKNELSEESLSGILLIDELAQHLHPQWQRRIVGHLKKQFPRMQLITTTHSPLIASSFGALPGKQTHDLLIHLGFNQDKEIEVSQLESLKGRDVEQVLASQAFDYLVDAEPEVQDILNKASLLAGKGDRRTTEEEAVYTDVKRILKEIMMKHGRTAVEIEVNEEIDREIVQRLAEFQALLGAPSND